MNDGQSLSERYQQRMLAKGKTSEELLMEDIKAQRIRKQEEKAKVKNFYAKLNGKLVKASTLEASVNK